MMKLLNSFHHRDSSLAEPKVPSTVEGLTQNDMREVVILSAHQPKDVGTVRELPLHILWVDIGQFTVRAERTNQGARRH
jgi:hypothetical protein